jgi:hydrogenase maturation protease
VRLDDSGPVASPLSPHLTDDEAGSVLVLGLGNPLLGDEGVGVRVIEELKGLDLPDGVVLVDGGTAGLSLISLMEGYQRVIVVDAAEMGQSPGRVVKFAPSEVQLRMTKDLLSLHQVGFGEVLALAEALGVSPPQLTIIGVQPDRIGVGEVISPEVEQAIPQCIGLVLSELDASESLAASD